MPRRSSLRSFDRLSRSLLDFAALMKQGRRSGWALVAPDLGGLLVCAVDREAFERDSCSARLHWYEAEFPLIQVDVEDKHGLDENTWRVIL